MSERIEIHRVLIANRGEIARRLNAYFKGRDIETVLVFAEAEADLGYLDDADYAVYLNGRTVEQTYRNVQRVVAAAHDAGADAIHPGYCFLAERVDFYQAALAANMPVFGPNLDVLRTVVDRSKLRGVARSIGIPLIPASEPLGAEEDGLAAAAQIGVPLFVKATAGQVMERVDSLDEVKDAVLDVRGRAWLITGDDGVYLERAVKTLRQVGTIVVADRHGSVVQLGHTDCSLEAGYCTWIEELGTEVVNPELGERLAQAAIALTREVGWMGVGRVRWAVLPDGGWYFLGFSARLTTGYSLAEQVHGIDLVDAQIRTVVGEPLGWERAQTVPKRHGLQFRLFHIDPSTLRRPEGVLERLEIPEQDGVQVELGAEVGQPVTGDHDPLLAKITVTGPTRQAAIVRAKAVLDEVVVEGVATNVDVLREALGSEALWRQTYDVHTLESLIGGDRRS